MNEMLKAAKAAKREIVKLTTEQKNAALAAMADALLAQEADGHTVGKAYNAFTVTEDRTVRNTYSVRAGGVFHIRLAVADYKSV